MSCKDLYTIYSQFKELKSVFETGLFPLQTENALRGHALCTWSAFNWVLTGLAYIAGSIIADRPTLTVWPWDSRSNLKISWFSSMNDNLNEIQPKFKLELLYFHFCLSLGTTWVWRSHEHLSLCVLNCNSRFLVLAKRQVMTVWTFLILLVLSVVSRILCFQTLYKPQGLGPKSQGFWDLKVLGLQRLEGLS